MAGVEMQAQQVGLTVHLTHGPSGSVIRTVPPLDNGGDASTFSPTDLVGAALASCAVSTMALVARREGIPFGDAKARVIKTMSPRAPRRIEKLELHIEMPKGVDPSHRARLEEIALGCPVARSLNAELSVPMTFSYS
jgi:putative redox protein